jgi:hypothetical protein
VHHAGYLRGVGQACGLGDGQRVHVRARQDRGARTVRKDAHDAGAAKADDLVTERGEFLHNEFSGPVLLEAEFRVPVQPGVRVPDPAHFLLEARQDWVVAAHGAHSLCGVRSAAVDPALLATLSLDPGSAGL